jgi:hypothetical protein
MRFTLGWYPLLPDLDDKNPPQGLKYLLAIGHSRFLEFNHHFLSLITKCLKQTV